MIAIPIGLILFGYLVLYAGVKQVSLKDAFNGVPAQQATPTPGQPVQTVPNAGLAAGTAVGSTITKAVIGDCRPRAGDIRIPWTGGTIMILRPNGPGALGWINITRVGPCRA